MTTQAPITAVITVYNGAAYLADAINSIKSQTLPVAEILVVDDGSSDGSVEIARALGVNVISQENQGGAAARNTGMRAATQAWVAFLDHDDIWEPEKIECQWRAHQLCPEAGLVFVDYCEFDDVTGETRVASIFNLPEAGFDRLPRWFVTDGISYLPKVDDHVYTIIRRNIFLPSATLIRRDLMTTAGAFHQNLFPMDDIDFFLRCFERTSVAFVERPLMRYRSHGTNTSKNQLKMLMAFFKFTDAMEKTPHLYPAGALAVLMSPLALAQKYSEAARLLIDVGEIEQARGLLKDSLRLKKSLRPVVLWAMTWFTPRSLGHVLRAKRSLHRLHRFNRTEDSVESA